MPHGRDHLIDQIFGLQTQAGGVDAGVHTHKFTLQYILVDEQLYPVFLIIHQSQDTHGAGGDVQKLLHILRRSKGQSGGTDLAGEFAGFELLGARDHQQVKVGTLPVA